MPLPSSLLLYLSLPFLCLFGFLFSSFWTLRSFFDGRRCDFRNPLQQSSHGIMVRCRSRELPRRCCYYTRMFQVLHWFGSCVRSRLEPRCGMGLAVVKCVLALSLLPPHRLPSLSASPTNMSDAAYIALGTKEEHEDSLDAPSFTVSSLLRRDARVSLSTAC